MDLIQLKNNRGIPLVPKTIAEGVSFDSNDSGLDATNVQDAIEALKALISNASIKDVYPELNPEALYVVDADGYVGLKLSSDGLDIAKISTHLASLIEEISSSGSGSGGGSDTPVVVDSTNWMYGKNIFSIGDSLSVPGKWQARLANIVGANFDTTINEQITENGKTTVDSGGNQDAAIILKGLKDNGAQVDVLFIENINDMTYMRYKLGTISDTPYFKGDIEPSTITIYAAIKGMLEYVTTNFPTTKIFYLIPTRFNIDFSNLTDYPFYSNGRFDLVEWNNYATHTAFAQDNKVNSGGNRDYTVLNTVIRECCKLYNVPYLDMTIESGINLCNGSTYYNIDVHPKDSGYNRWGETIARLLTGK